jgi:para-nitrobenzyl esterase
MVVRGEGTSHFRCRMKAAFTGIVMIAGLNAFGTDASAAAISRASALAASSLLVPTQYGPVLGTTIGNMRAFAGIPYAAPPVGELRWEPPRPHLRWSAPLRATQFANHCPQNQSAFGLKSITEDCLYLNVFAPSGSSSRSHLPVMVWIHGGAFTAGESDDFDPDRLVARGVIIVTLNYRLGPLGFLATPGLDKECHPHVNYGIMDQQMALRWVRNNIGAFGGDASDTTIFGESAGGLSVIAQLVSPAAGALFQRAIIESGAYSGAQLPTLSAAEASGSAFAAAVHCGSSTTCLRALPVSGILAQEPKSFSLSTLTSPAVDGSVIPQEPQTALFSGQYNRVPIMQGTNHDEFRFFTAALFDLVGSPLSAAEYPTAVSQTLAAGGLQSDTPLVLEQYPVLTYPSPDLAYSAFTTDSIFSTGAYVTDILFSLQSPLYAYEFADEQAPEDYLPPVSFPYGAAHASELQFIWDFFVVHSMPLPSLTPAEQTLAATMVSYWTNFARTAYPTDFGVPLWTPYNARADNMEKLVPPHPQLFFTFAQEHKTVFWESLQLGRQPSQAPSAQDAARVHLLPMSAPDSAARALRPH